MFQYILGLLQARRLYRHSANEPQEFKSYLLHFIDLDLFLRVVQYEIYHTEWRGFMMHTRDQDETNA